MDNLKIPLIDSAFSSWSRSASLREENKHIHPTHFSWAIGPEYPAGLPYFYTDNAILRRDTFARNSVAWLLEPRCLRPENYEAVKEKADQFIAVLSYDKEFLEEIPNGRWYPFGGSSISFDKWGIYPKSKNVCMFCSDKGSMEGHQLRHAIVEEFSGRIDFYGESVGRRVDHKFDVLKDYRYCVIVESCKIDGYFSEKLIDVISVGTVPLYYGSNCLYGAYSHDAPRFCIYKFDSISTLNELIKLKDTLYKHFPTTKFIEYNLDHARKFRICEDWIYEHYGDLFDEKNYL